MFSLMKWLLWTVGFQCGHTAVCAARTLPVAYVDDVPGPDVLLLYFASQVHAAHGHQVGFIRTQADVFKETVVQRTRCGYGHWAHAQLHSWTRKEGAIANSLTSEYTQKELLCFHHHHSEDGLFITLHPISFYHLFNSWFSHWICAASL